MLLDYHLREDQIDENKVDMLIKRLDTVALMSQRYIWMTKLYCIRPPKAVFLNYRYFVIYYAIILKVEADIIFRMM